MTVESQPGPGWWIDHGGTPRPPNEHPDADWRERWGTTEQTPQAPSAPADTPEAAPANAVPKQPVPTSAAPPEMRQSDDGRWQRRGPDGFWYFSEPPGTPAQQVVADDASGSIAQTAALPEPSGVERASSGHPADCLYCDFEETFKHRYTPRGEVTKNPKPSVDKQPPTSARLPAPPQGKASHGTKAIVLAIIVVVVLLVGAVLGLSVALGGHSISWKDGYATAKRTIGAGATPNDCTRLSYGLMPSGDTRTTWVHGCATAVKTANFAATHPGAST